MRLGCLALLGTLLGICAAGCPASVGERNAFLTLTEQFGTFVEEEVPGGAGGGAEVQGVFRSPMTITLANNNPDADLEVSLAAWVNVSSVRTAEQQDALLAEGYVRLTREVRLGNVFRLPPGTFVYDGPGVAGAQALRVARAQGDDTAAAVATTAAFTLTTPDVILVFEEPPVSCESVAFTFTDSGFPLDTEYVPGGRGHVFEGATGRGGTKTLAQVDAYQCQPFQPGLFLKLGGGAREANEYFEGDNVRFDFNPTPANGYFALVTIGSTSETATSP